MTRTSEYFICTTKEIPADAELPSHRLMLRAGMIRKAASGIYTWLPLGYRVLQKVEAVVRQEMNDAGCQEILMPAVQPAELWCESGRWDKYGPELLRFQDRHARDFCLGPTHEEVVVELVRSQVRSYKQLPMTLYQIQTKFRDEIRPRFGVMRGREFIMKDAYSFHMDQASLQATYDTLYQAYCNIFTRLGLKFRAVMADSGAIGGSVSHEFQVLADSGEDVIAYCENSDYAANVELASAALPEPANLESCEAAARKKVHTPGCRSIEALCAHLNVPPSRTVKTLLVAGQENTPVVALILRGDHSLNEVKVAHLPQVAKPLRLLSESEALELGQEAVGYLGPVGLEVPMVVDYEAAALCDFVCGANEVDQHWQHVCWGRDVALPAVADLRTVIAGDMSPDKKGPLQLTRGIEVGHIFQNGDVYTKPMKAEVLDEGGKHRTLLTGCYGIGVSRIVAAAIEQNHDERGILWSDTMAPFEIALLPMHMHKSYRVREAAEMLYAELTTAGYDVLFDDRKERPGVMFADMDLIGVPHRLVVSEKGIDQGMVEYKARRTGVMEHLAINDILNLLAERVG
jgi:prolyl-tRNA synthetase